MPAKTEKQRRFFGAELGRRREGKVPRAKGISIAEVEKMASKPRGKVKPKKRGTP